MVLETADVAGSYKLTNVNGKKSVVATLKITAVDKEIVEIVVRVANRIFGRGSLKENVLKGSLASTLMFPPPEMVNVEKMIHAGFASGFFVQKSPNTLTLRNGKDTLTFASV